jgi:hypothetical protein
MLSPFFGCSSGINLVSKSKTNYGQLNFYSEKAKKGDTDIQRIYASVDSSGKRSYYSFSADRIVKTTETTKELTYTVYYGPLPEKYDTHLYHKFSFLDSLVLTQGDNLLDSLGLDNFKRSKGSEGYIIEVSYYHGYPKNKKFKP